MCWMFFCCCTKKEPRQNAQAEIQKSYVDVLYDTHEVDQLLGVAEHLGHHHVRPSLKKPGWFSVNLTPELSPEIGRDRAMSI